MINSQKCSKCGATKFWARNKLYSTSGLKKCAKHMWIKTENIYKETTQ